MIAVELSRIIIDEEKREQIVILKEKRGLRILPIVVGISEVAAIRMELNRIAHSRPLTHDLIKLIIETLHATLEKVVIDKLMDGIFYAKLYFKTGEGDRIVDARPSDSLALALRTKSPVFVEAGVFESLSREAE